jgi:hypothetical protein
MPSQYICLLSRASWMQLTNTTSPVLELGATSHTETSLLGTHAVHMHIASVGLTLTFACIWSLKIKEGNLGTRILAEQNWMVTCIVAPRK